jgi:hypothetical protein
VKRGLCGRAYGQVGCFLRVPQVAPLIWVVVLVFNGTFKNISVILWRSVVFVERPGVHEENNRPAHMHDHKGPFSHLYLLCVMCYLKFVCLLWNIALCDSIWPCRWIYLVLVKYIHLSCFNVFGEWVNEKHQNDNPNKKICIVTIC